MRATGKEYRLVVVGRKGSGKSTLINMVANLSQGKKYSDQRMIAITQAVMLPGNKERILQCNVPEYKAISTGSTSTTECNSYTFIGQGYTLTLIDTPGLELQNNGKEDTSTLARIVDAVAEVGTFDGIVLVHRADDDGPGISVSSLLSACRSLLPLPSQDNVQVVLTRVRNPASIPARAIFTREGMGMDRLLYMDNACLIPDDLYPSSGDRDSDTFERNMRKTLWNRTVSEYENMLKSLNKLVRVDRQTLERIFTLRLDTVKITQSILGTQANVGTMKALEDILSTKANISRLEADLLRERAQLLSVDPPHACPVPPVEDPGMIWAGHCTLCNMLCMHLDASMYSSPELRQYILANGEKECNSRYILCNHPISAHTFTLAPYSSTVFCTKDNNTGLGDLDTIQQERDIIERIDCINQDIRASKRLLADMGGEFAASLIQICLMNREMMEYAGKYFCDRFLMELEQRIDESSTGDASSYLSLLEYYQSIQSSTLSTSIDPNVNISLLSAESAIVYYRPLDSGFEKSITEPNECKDNKIESMRSAARSDKDSPDVQLHGLRQVNQFINKFDLDSL